MGKKKTKTKKTKGPITVQVVIDSWNEFDGEPDSKLVAVGKELGIDPKVVRAKLRTGLGSIEYGKLFPRGTFPIDAQGLVDALNKDGRYKERKCIDITAKELKVNPGTVRAKLHSWGITKGPYEMAEEE